MLWNTNSLFCYLNVLPESARGRRQRSLPVLWHIALNVYFCSVFIFNNRAGHSKMMIVCDKRFDFGANSHGRKRKMFCPVPPNGRRGSSWETVAVVHVFYRATVCTFCCIAGLCVCVWLYTTTELWCTLATKQNRKKTMLGYEFWTTTVCVCANNSQDTHTFSIWRLAYFDSMSSGASRQTAWVWMVKTRTLPTHTHTHTRTHTHTHKNSFE